MISKEMFITAIGVLQEREKAMARIRGDLGYLGLDLSGDPLEGTLVDVLDAALGLAGCPCGGAVSWWWWDCFTSRQKGQPVEASIGNKEYRVSTAEDLYDYAVDLKQCIDDP